MLGTPRVSLPVSQLRLGRSGPPWNAVAWRGGWKLDNEHCVLIAQDDDVHAPLSFRAVPRCFPSGDLTLCYSFRLFQHVTSQRMAPQGVLPGFAVGWPIAQPPSSSSSSAALSALSRSQSSDNSLESNSSSSSGTDDVWYCLVEWTRGEAVVVRAWAGQVLFDDAGLRFRRGKWNDVVLRVRMNSWDERGAPRRDGVVSLALNGRAATLQGLVVCPCARQALCGVHVVAAASPSASASPAVAAAASPSPLPVTTAVGLTGLSVVA